MRLNQWAIFLFVSQTLFNIACSSDTDLSETKPSNSSSQLAPSVTGWPIGASESAENSPCTILEEKLRQAIIDVSSARAAVTQAIQNQQNETPAGNSTDRLSSPPEHPTQSSQATSLPSRIRHADNVYNEYEQCVLSPSPSPQELLNRFHSSTGPEKEEKLRRAAQWREKIRQAAREQNQRSCGRTESPKSPESPLSTGVDPECLINRNEDSTENNSPSPGSSSRAHSASRGLKRVSSTPSSFLKNDVNDAYNTKDGLKMVTLPTTGLIDAQGKPTANWNKIPKEGNKATVKIAIKLSQSNWQDLQKAAMALASHKTTPSHLEPLEGLMRDFILSWIAVFDIYYRTLTTNDLYDEIIQKLAKPNSNTSAKASVLWLAIELEQLWTRENIYRGGDYTLNVNVHKEWSEVESSVQLKQVESSNGSAPCVGCLLIPLAREPQQADKTRGNLMRGITLQKIEGLDSDSWEVIAVHPTTSRKNNSLSQYIQPGMNLLYRKKGKKAYSVINLLNQRRAAQALSFMKSELRNSVDSPHGKVNQRDWQNPVCNGVEYYDSTQIAQIAAAKDAAVGPNNLLPVAPKKLNKWQKFRTTKKMSFANENYQTAKITLPDEIDDKGFVLNVLFPKAGSSKSPQRACPDVSESTIPDSSPIVSLKQKTKTSQNQVRYLQGVKASGSTGIKIQFSVRDLQLLTYSLAQLQEGNIMLKSTILGSLEELLAPLEAKVLDNRGTGSGSPGEGILYYNDRVWLRDTFNPPQPAGKLYQPLVFNAIVEAFENYQNRKENARLSGAPETMLIVSLYIVESSATLMNRPMIFVRIAREKAGSTPEPEIAINTYMTEETLVLFTHTEVAKKIIGTNTFTPSASALDKLNRFLQPSSPNNRTTSKNARQPSGTQSKDAQLKRSNSSMRLSPAQSLSDMEPEPEPEPELE